MAVPGVVATETPSGRQVCQISFSQIDPSSVDHIVEGQEVILVTLNDLDASINPKFISVVRAIIRHRKMCAFSVSGWDADPRPIAEIPEARCLFNLAATQYGILGLIEDKIRLGLLPVMVGTSAGSVVEQEIDEFVACCIGQYLYNPELGKSVFTIDLDQKERLIHISRRVYRELYHDLL